MSHRISARRLTLFVLCAFAGAWLVAAPLWLSGQGLAAPGAPVVLVAMMFVPTVAALVTQWIAPNGRRFTQVTTLKPRLPLRGWLPYAVTAWLAPIVITLASLVVAGFLGWYRFDLADFSGAREALSAAGAAALPGMDVSALVTIQLVAMLVAPLLNVLPALGEEIGWRGLLQTELLPLGQWPAAVVTGIVWGLWHAPVILLGYNYPGVPPVAALGMMIVFCVLLSVLLCWLTVASGTVWTAAVAHGFINGVAGLGMLLAAAGPLEAGLVGLLGASGWIVMAAVIVLLVVLRRFPVGKQARRRQRSTAAVAD